MAPRRVLYRPEFVAGYVRAYRQAQADLHDLHFKHMCQMADLRRELDVLRAELAQLRELDTVVRARQNAEIEVAELRRRREIVKAFGAERDPAAPLQ